MKQVTLYCVHAVIGSIVNIQILTAISRIELAQASRNQKVDFVNLKGRRETRWINVRNTGRLKIVLGEDRKHEMKSNSLRNRKCQQQISERQISLSDNLSVSV